MDIRDTKGKRQTLKGKARDEIIQLILRGELSPGDKINESKICERLGLSKSPVREAITELVSEGLLLNEAFKGTFVSLFTDKEMIDLSNLRSVLEAMAVDYAAKNIDDQSRDALLEITMRMKSAADSNDTQLMSELDMEFHYFIIRLSGSTILTDTWERIYSRLRIHFFYKNLMFKDLDLQYTNHHKLAECFSLDNLPLFKNLLIEHNFFNYFFPRDLLNKVSIHTTER